MDAETKQKFDNVELQIEYLSKDLTKSIRMGFKGVRQYQDANALVVQHHLEEIVAQGLIRNGRLEKVESVMDTVATKADVNALDTCMGLVRKETSPFRWAVRNPKISIPGVVIIIGFIVAAGFFIEHRVDINQTIKNHTGISIIDNVTKRTVTNEK